MPHPAPAVSIVVLADGPWDETFRCLTALREGAAGVDHELVVMDDGTADETRLALPRLPGVTTARSDEPLGLARAAGAALGIARAPLVAFLHADAEPNPGWLAPLAAVATGDPAVSAVASRLVTPSGLVEADGILFAYAAPYPITPVPHGAGDCALPAADVLSVPAASLAALLVRADAVRAAGGLDETLGPAAVGLDLCLRLRAAGGEVLVARESVAIHRARCPGDLSDADAARFTRRWLGKVPLLDRAGLRGRPAPAPRAGRAPLSVIVPARDALATIAPSLEALARGLGPDDELILADAGSGDGTREFAALFVGERGGGARLVDAAAGGLEGALRAGLDAARRPRAVLFHPVAEAPDGFLDALTLLLDRPGAPSAAATPMPPAGCCVAGPTALLREVGAATPAAFLSADPTSLGAALAARGAALGLVEQAGGH